MNTGCIVSPEPHKDNPLWNYFINNKKRSIYKLRHYFDIYDNHFNRYRNTSVSILEIGVGGGGSLQMWKEYFGPSSRIYGLDTSNSTNYAEDQIKIFIGDQGNKVFLDKVISEIKTLDIVIDDGSHLPEHQITSFEKIFPIINPNGIYLVEDVCTSYWKDYHGGYKKDNTFIEYSKRLIDQLNAWHSKEKDLTVNDFTKSTTGIHFYDSVVVFERHTNTEPPVYLKK